jgi:cysteinyl-tRNA synthetase
MGLLGSDPEAFLKGVEQSDLELIRTRIADRAAARRAHEFAKADEIRAELADLGVIVEDKPDGTTDWRRG